MQSANGVLLALKNLDYLFENNKAWAASIKEKDPDFFSNLSKQQTPEYLWIGCSDSRVAANQIVNLLPGEMFVHRNIANLVVHSDLNCLSVIQYAVEVLKIEHIIVCGHYGCGGVRAALKEEDHGLIDNWLEHVKDIARFNEPELSLLPEEQRVDRLCELNVKVQVLNVCATQTIQSAWKKGTSVAVYGVIYNIEDGILRDLKTQINSTEQFKKIRYGQP